MLTMIRGRFAPFLHPNSIERSIEHPGHTRWWLLRRDCDRTGAGGASLIYSTYLGGSGDDGGHDIAVDHSGDAYVAGVTTSANFLIKNVVQATFGGGRTDAFVTELSPATVTRLPVIITSNCGGSGSPGHCLRTPAIPGDPGIWERIGINARAGTTSYSGNLNLKDFATGKQLLCAPMPSVTVVSESTSFRLHLSL